MIVKQKSKCTEAVFWVNFIFRLGVKPYSIFLCSVYPIFHSSLSFLRRIFLWITGNKAAREQTLPFPVCGVPGLSLKAQGVSPDCHVEGMPFPEEIKRENLKTACQHWHLLLSFLRFVFRKHNLLKILKSGQNIIWEKSLWCQWASLTPATRVSGMTCGNANDFCPLSPSSRCWYSSKWKK